PVRKAPAARTPPSPVPRPRPAPDRPPERVTPQTVTPPEAMSAPQSAPTPAASAPPPASSAPAIADEAHDLSSESLGGLARGRASGALAHAATPILSASAPLSEAPATSSPVAAAPAWPPSTKLSYTITGYWRGDLHGSGALVWTVDGDHYEATLSGSALISFDYRSTGRVDGDWLAPTRYTERVFTREKSIVFDRASDTLRFSAIPDMLPLLPHVQDSASLFLQLAHRLTTRPGDFHPGATLTFAVARPSGMTNWTFTIAGTDTVPTPVGPLLCWHIVRQATQANELGAQIWLAPQLQNLPVQIRLQQSADSFLLFTLDHAEQEAPPQSPASAAP
ncbi:MAG: DUF3108 domain-containing protein, partial [Burkholderiaceae bacterium]|nr:DUF3108 domain-containing protein [Burkholderiaceae bacterium]